MARTSDNAIHRAGYREQLAPRREPYWRELIPRGHLGYRKSDTGSETWVARWTDEAYNYKYERIGALTEYSFDQAKARAEEWFASCKVGVVRAGTVEEACKLYVANLATEKGEQASQFAKWTFTATVYDKDFGRTKLDKLTPAKVTAWRDALVADGKREKNSANRIIRSFKAAMNYAYRQGLVSNSRSWDVVQQFKEADGQRTVYLDAKQRAALLAKCSPELADLVKGWFYTAARPTELTVARVKDFSPATATLTLRTHKGNGSERVRTVPLTADAVTLLKRLAKNRLPEAYLFVKAGGEPWTRHQYGAELRKAVADAEVKPKKTKLPQDTVAYTMRHTAISEWLQAGVDIATVAKLAGTSVAMIDRYYHKYIRTSVEDKLATVKL